jgi:hypothetical protein
MVSLGLSGVIFVVNETRKQVPPAPPHPILNFIAADPSRPEPPPYFKLHTNQSQPTTTTHHKTNLNHSMIQSTASTGTR